MPAALGARAVRFRAPDTHEQHHAVTEDWRRYRASRCPDSRDRLVVHYMHTHVRPIAASMRGRLPSQVDLDDLIQQGYLGLIDAMDRFDANRDTRFETFSRRRICGAIQDYLRSIDHVPRLTRARSKRVERHCERFRKQHGRPPREDELRELLDVDEPSFRRFLADRSPAAAVPFSNVLHESEAEPEADADAMDAFEDPTSAGGPAIAAARRDFRRWLTRGFTHRDRLILILYYYEAMTMREIGRTLGISESRVSQRLESILACLRSQLTATGAETEFLFH
jgi:RNA polymerase sigma factor for flagellar operon FliA